MNNRGYNAGEVIKFTLSLIFAALSVNLMFVTDRSVLGLYSIDSMNAASLGGNFVAMISFVATSIAQIAVVFVGQYNGSKEYHKTAYAPWQMIYLGLLSFMFFVPLGFCCEHLNLFPEHYAAEGNAYVKVLLEFAGFHVISMALSSFFIGRKQSYIVIVTFFIGNILNAILDFALVFGIKGLFPPMGAKGAAITTISIEFIFVLIFSVVFFNKNNRAKFNTMDAQFRPKLFWDCIKVGAPVSLGKFLNLLGWFLIMSCFINASKDLATIESFIVGFWTAFIFVADGAGRAIAALSANLIGKERLEDIKNLLKKFLIFNFIISAIYSIPLVFYPEIAISFLSQANGDIAHLIPDLKFTLVGLLVILITDGIFYLVCGVLTAGGDTKFPMVLETITLWGVAVTPIAIMYHTGNLTSIRPPYILIPMTGVINSVVIYFRYKKQKWYKSLIYTFPNEKSDGYRVETKD